MDAAQWHQEMGLLVNPPSSSSSCSSMEVVMVPSSSAATACAQSARPPPPPHPIPMEKRTPRPQKEQALNCPRCNSSNTKFCYYNNYSLTQPRYFCKTCRRYWTEGGSLRNVPVGGGSRKNRRPSSSTTPTTPSLQSAAKKLPDLTPTPMINSAGQNPSFHDAHHDLNLSFPHHHHYMGLGGSSAGDHCSPVDANTTASLSAMDMLRSGLSPFVQMPVQESSSAVYQSGGFPMQQDPRSATSLNFSIDDDGAIGVGSNIRGRYDHNMQLLPFEDLRQMAAAPSSTAPHEYHHHEQNHRGQGGGGGGGSSSGFWSGMMGGGAAW